MIIYTFFTKENFLKISCTCRVHISRKCDAELNNKNGYSDVLSCFIICCEISFVASLAFGIRNLSMSEIMKFSDCVDPYLKVIKSGCLFRDVIRTILDNGRFTITWAAPFRPWISRSTIMCVSVTKRWLQQFKIIN